jgi:peptide/nickel transport system substrate-binding protein
LAAVPTAVVLAVGAAACGSSTKAGDGGASGSIDTSGQQSISAQTGGTGASAPSTPKGGKLTFGIDQDYDYWDGTSYYGDMWAVEYATCNGLLDYPDSPGPDNATLVPGIAADMPQVSGDGKTYTFTIRDGLKFNNGQPVTAADVKDTYERSLDPSAGFDMLGSGYYNDLVGMDKYAPSGATKPGAPGISGITVAGNKVSFALNGPDASFPYYTAIRFACIVPKGTPHKHTQLPPPMTGPYMIKSYTPKRSVLMVRNPYWADNAKVMGNDCTNCWNVDEFDFKEGISGDSQLLQIRNNQLDLSYDRSAPTGAQVNAVLNDPSTKSRVSVTPDAAIGYFFFNTTVPPFDNPKVRQAVNYGIDRTSLIKLVGGQYTGTPWSQILPKNLLGDEKADIYPNAPDIAKAKQLLQESGVKTPISTTLIYQNKPPGDDIAANFKQTMAQIGIDVTLKGLSSDVYYQYVQSPKNKAPMGTAIWGQDFPDAVTFFVPLLHSGSLSNYSQYRSAATDAAIGKAKLIPPGPDRARAWAQLSTKVESTDAPWAVYRNRLVVNFFSARLGGFAYNTTKQLYFNLLYVKR